MLPWLSTSAFYFVDAGRSRGSEPRLENKKKSIKKAERRSVTAEDVREVEPRLSGQVPN